MMYHPARTGTLRTMRPIALAALLALVLTGCATAPNHDEAVHAFAQAIADIDGDAGHQPYDTDVLTRAEQYANLATHCTEHGYPDTQGWSNSAAEVWATGCAQLTD